MEEKAKAEITLNLRYAEATHLLRAMDRLPEEAKKSVTHQDLVRQLTIIKDHWLKLENLRKLTQKNLRQLKKNG